ncbi:MAG: alpha-amylase family glycosyl hydrolase, partial [Candidatus Dormibacteraeota bacterium]|nr:alpha-amylase family glycosyl hydrolase [Candidatus Dormibacteraeota bacterium]
MSVPRATYRVQLTPDFGFDATAAIVPYLARLGVSHLYFSPYLQAAPGSRHGYDVVDHSHVNAELGGEAGHARLVLALGAAGLGQVLDIVPNHMAASGRRNRWWWDVLKHGPDSRFAAYFDVDWNPPDQKLRGLILAPVLGDHYGRELEAGNLRLERDGDELLLRYHEHEFPIDPGSVLELFGGPLTGAQVADVTADPDRLDELLERQHYRLARWRVAAEELDYRRFFDVNELVAIRTEEPEVFARTHELVLGWLRAGVVAGLRVDHPDGLRDPHAYFERLAEAGAAWVLAEKILAPGEELPERWPVAGTTGYEFLNLVLGLFVDPAAGPTLRRVFARFAGIDQPWPDVAAAGRRFVMDRMLAADLRRLVALFEKVV